MKRITCQLHPRSGDARSSSRPRRLGPCCSLRVARSFQSGSRAPDALDEGLHSQAIHPPPMTPGKRRVIAASRSPLESEIVDLYQASEAPFDRDLFVLEWLRLLVGDRVPGIDRVSFQRLAQCVHAAPISATRLPGRKRINRRALMKCLRSPPMILRSPVRSISLSAIILPADL